MNTNGKVVTREGVVVQNLIRYVPSGGYYSRFKLGGKLIRRRQKTTALRREKRVR